MTNLEQFREVTTAGRFTLQASSMLKVRLEYDQIQTKLGPMGPIRTTCASSTRAVARALLQESRDRQGRPAHDPYGER